jgi:adenosyl cobinamide kinase/adenosyl cobinamide phosphate guanylyltransferase
MRLVIGGAYQGKLEYVLTKYGKSLVCDGNTCTLEDTFTCGVINNFQWLIKRYFQTVEEATNYLENLLECNNNVVIISTEIGCGIVPISREDRDYRELVGRVCCEVSKRAETVERVFCGIAKLL